MERKKKGWINAGSVASALGLVGFFAGSALGLAAMPLRAAAIAAAAVSAATLMAMTAARQDGGKDAISGNRLAGQGALTALLALAVAVAFR